MNANHLQYDHWRRLAMAGLISAGLILGSPVLAQARGTAEPAAAQPPQAPAPSEIVAAALGSDWVAIAPDDLLVMTLAPDARGHERRVIIQLMPAPFSQGWVANIRTFARAHWYDGVSVNRVQDNYVVQWGDPDGDDPTKAKAMPAGLRAMTEDEYVAPISYDILTDTPVRGLATPEVVDVGMEDSYAARSGFALGWPVGLDGPAPERRGEGLRRSRTADHYWPIHCYGMVGVGRGLSPDSGSGAELYTVIGHAPRHLDRNIALVGRVIEGIEHLSSLPRGTEALGFYATAEERVPILSIRLASDLPAAEQPRFEYLASESASFARYADARANRRDPFFIRPAGGADICNIPVPVRRLPQP